MYYVYGHLEELPVVAAAPPLAAFIPQGTIRVGRGPMNKGVRVNIINANSPTPPPVVTVAAGSTLPMMGVG